MSYRDISIAYEGLQNLGYTYIYRRQSFSRDGLYRVIPALKRDLLPVRRRTQDNQSEIKQPHLVVFSTGHVCLGNNCDLDPMGSLKSYLYAICF